MENAEPDFKPSCDVVSIRKQTNTHKKIEKKKNKDQIRITAFSKITSARVRVGVFPARWNPHISCCSCFLPNFSRNIAINVQLSIFARDWQLLSNYSLTNCKALGRLVKLGVSPHAGAICVSLQTHRLLCIFTTFRLASLHLTIYYYFFLPFQNQEKQDLSKSYYIKYAPTSQSSNYIRII